MDNTTRTISINLELLLAHVIIMWYLAMSLVLQEQKGWEMGSGWVDQQGLGWLHQGLGLG